MGVVRSFKFNLCGLDYHTVDIYFPLGGTLQKVLEQTILGGREMLCLGCHGTISNHFNKRLESNRMTALSVVRVIGTTETVF